MFSCKFAVYFQNTLLNHPNAMAISSIYKYRERFCSVMLQLKKLLPEVDKLGSSKAFRGNPYEFCEAILNSIHSWCVSFLLVISNKSKTK